MHFDWIGVVFWIGVGGTLLYWALIWSWFWLGYKVVGKSIQVRFLHVLPIWSIPIADVASIRLIEPSKVLYLLDIEFGRPYVHLELRRGLIRSVSITPFSAARFVVEVRKHMP